MSRAVATIKDVDEYGPIIEWRQHWGELKGRTLYVDDLAQEKAEPVAYRWWDGAGWIHGNRPLPGVECHPLYTAPPAERVRVPDEVRQALEFYAGGGHIVEIHIRDRKEGEPEGYAWWPAKRAELASKGYSAFGEGAYGSETFVEWGDTAQAALDVLSAAPEADHHD